MDVARARGPEASETAREALWAMSVARYNERQRRQIRAAWFSHFCLMAENHAALAESYQRRAEELCEGGVALPQGARG